MNYKTLLEKDSPRLLELEAMLGKAGEKPGIPRKPTTRVCYDGQTRGGIQSLSQAEMEIWFWKMLVKNVVTGCWEWIGCVHHSGYGIFKFQKKNWSPHKFAATIVLGAPPSLEVCHTCDNEICACPSHLWLGTSKDNKRDAVEKGRHYIPRGEKNGQATITLEEALEVRALAVASLIPQAVIADTYGISQPQVSRIKFGQKWKEQI